MATVGKLGSLFAAIVACSFAAGCSADAGDEDDDLDGEDSSLTSTNEAAVDSSGSLVVATFVNPDKAKTPITDEIKRLVSSAPAGATIRIGIFNLTLPDVAQALIDAQNINHAIVQIVGDGQLEASSSPAVVNLKANIASHKFCQQASGGFGCLPRNDTSIMHSKWMTITSAKDASGVMHQNVSWFGSANLTGATGQNSFNNTITVYDDKKLHDSFVVYFDTLKSQRNVKDNFFDQKNGLGYYHSPTATVFASPEKETDFVYDQLNAVVPGEGCVIRVAQATFHDGRKNLATLLASKKAHKCKVGVVVGHDKAGKPDIDPQVFEILHDAGITVRSRDNIHSKFVLVHGQIGSKVQDVVFTGSHNWTSSALELNDEIFVRMADNHALFTAYVKHFNDQYSSAAKLRAAP